MQPMLWNIILLALGFFILVRGADAFVDGASALAQRFKIPQIIIGLTVVAMGTSAPEAAVSISSVLHGSGGVAVGNVIGSNIANILLILGVTAMITPLFVQKKTIQYEIPFVTFITIVLMWFGAKYGAVTRLASGVFIAFFVVFLSYLYLSAKQHIVQTVQTTKMSAGKIIIFLILGLAALVFGSNLTVNSATNLVALLHVPDRIIGLTLVAFGTSLPELVTCIVAARKKQTDLIIGNIIGSNIFNILFVLGITGLIHPISFEYSFLIDAAISVVITTFLWIITIYEQSLNRKTGILFLTGYILYLVYLI